MASAQKKDNMADFAFIKDQGVWINLDYVVRMEPGADDESTSVTFTDGSTFTISQADGKRLVRRFRPRKKKKKKKKKKEVGAQGAEEATEVEE